MITIDGSFGEGGGQILRTSLALAAITKQSVTIENIRANRTKPGLRPQHLTGALAVAEICGGELIGGDVGSRKIIFKPGKVRPGSYEFDVSKIKASAGSVNLILQTVLWPLALTGKKSRVTIRGGTHVPFAPTSDYIDDTFLPAVAEMGLPCHYSMIRAGYYPIGGGEVRVEIPAIDRVNPVSMMEPGDMQIELVSAVSNLPTSIAERQLDTAAARLRSMGVHFSGSIKQHPSLGKGTIVYISCRSSSRARAGFQSLGELKKRAEKVADEACDELEAYLRTGMALDKHLADQLIIPIALAQGNSRFTTCEITPHLLTNIAIVEKFLPVHFHVSSGLGKPGTITRTE